jgi:predicted small lipoprotein YifL
MKKANLLYKVFILLVVSFVLASCGKKGALIYPDMLTPAAPTDVKAAQLGSAVKLSFVLPQKDQAGRRLHNLAGVDVFKRSTVTGQGAGCNACTVDYTLFKKIYINTPDSRVVRRDNQLVLLDSEVRKERDYHYYIIPFTDHAEAGKPSLPVSITVVEPPAPPRLVVAAEPTEIRLKMVDTQFQKGDFFGYNLYRAVKGEAFTVFPHNRELIKNSSFTDVGLKRGESYVYAVRTVARRASGTLAESDLSNLAEARLAED